MTAPTPPGVKTVTADNGYQAMIDAETVDEFVHSQTTRKEAKYKKDIKEFDSSERTIHRFLSNACKSRFNNVANYDEVLDPKDHEFYVHANTIRSPWGNFIIAQKPISETLGDFLHLLWIYNVRTIVSMLTPEDTGEYFDVAVGGKYTSLFRYTMKTLNVFNEKQGITVYQCELSSFRAPGPARMIYIVCCPTPASGPRNARMHSVALEVMWACEETNAIEGYNTTVLVHGEAGTRRCAAFVASAMMCRQILETGKFSSMDTWVEIRKRRYGACSRRQDFYSSLLTVFQFCHQIGLVSGKDESYTKTTNLLNDLINREAIAFTKPPPSTPLPGSSAMQ
ncbi:unnamed protein product [Caenorhabditis bovis]|uniref:Tyrosine-protein phosphatase domain-containing protein n=1 Tax=Caenorhabditis bovis TaxID=2654633 RepID=A0A8S1FCY3_9PELO|nr:unnamed protein product [Caenorhabditis bovis]